MFATALRTASRSLSTRATTTPLLASTSLRQQPILAATASPLLRLSRSYASGGGLSKDDITARVLEVVKSFEKVNQGKLTPTAHFAKDLGLDSLDTVEVVMAIEEEFAVEIPDHEADGFYTIGQAIDYIANTSEAV